MNTYMLYGTKLIEKDDTLKDFALSVCRNVQSAYSNEPEDATEVTKKENFMGLVDQIIVDDLGRTNIDYPFLMYKYRQEIGGLLYDIDNHSGDCANYELTFFGEKAESCFNMLLFQYIDIHLDELLKELNSKPITAEDIINQKIAQLKTRENTECYLGVLEACAQIRILNEVLAELKGIPSTKTE